MHWLEISKEKLLGEKKKFHMAFRAFAAIIRVLIGIFSVPFLNHRRKNKYMCVIIVPRSLMLVLLGHS